jgi:hypothetical protein
VTSIYDDLTKGFRHKDENLLSADEKFLKNSYNNLDKLTIADGKLEGQI